MRLRLATFNIENLFTRFDFDAFTNARDERYLSPIVQFYAQYGTGDLTQFEDFKRFVETAAVSQDDDKRQQTSLAFAEADADIYGLQEVDNIGALTRFMDAYVKKIGVDPYPQLVLHEGNDPRGIDVAAVARDIRPVTSRSYANLTGAWVDDTDTGKALLDTYKDAAAARKKLRGRIFRRDCLELETHLAGQTVSIFNCHFKSMGGGRSKSMGMRQLEAITVREIITRKYERLGVDPAEALWVVMGDLNDYQLRISVGKSRSDDGQHVETVKREKKSGVDPLLKDGFGFNTLELLPERERWTHYYAPERHKTQLDYIIASPAMKDRITGMPQIIRSGMPYRVPNTKRWERYPRIGWDRPKASDHCPVVVQFDVR